VVYERQFEDLHYALRVVDEDGALVFRPGVKKYSSLTKAAKAATGYSSISAEEDFSAAC